MHPTRNEDVLNRRDFLKTSAAATVAAGVASAPAIAQASAKKMPGGDGLIHRNERPAMQYRKLGRTNYMASALVFGCGAALAGGKAVNLLDRTFEAGINFYDIGSGIFYRGSEKHFAPFLKAHRDDVWVSSKAPVRAPGSKEDGTPLTVEQGKAIAKQWTTLLETSLKDLEQDYVDAYYVMGVGDPAVVRCEELHNAFVTARDAGKVGHLGVSTHKRAKEVLEAAIETGWYDLAMIAITPAGWYDWDSKSLLEGTPPMRELRPLLDRARAAGIGLVGMKAGRYLSGGADKEAAFDGHYNEKQMGSGFNSYQRAYAFVLQNGVDVVNADMQNFAHLEENLVAAAQSATYFA